VGKCRGTTTNGIRRLTRSGGPIPSSAPGTPVEDFQGPEQRWAMRKSGRRLAGKSRNPTPSTCIGFKHNLRLSVSPPPDSRTFRSRHPANDAESTSKAEATNETSAFPDYSRPDSFREVPDDGPTPDTESAQPRVAKP
jgi:hypothetical protein